MLPNTRVEPATAAAPQQPAAAAAAQQPSRRGFLIGVVAAGAGLTLGFHVPQGQLAKRAGAADAPPSPTVNPINGDQVIALAKAAADLRTTVSRGEAPGGIGYTRTVQADESGRPMLEHWVLHGVGHAWSGGSAAGSYTEPRGPDASREMMRFFLEQPATVTALS